MQTALPIDLVRAVFSFAPRSLLDVAVADADLTFVQLVVAVDTSRVTQDHMAEAATQGHLSIVRFLQHAVPTCRTWRAIRDAATQGHLEAVKFLYSHGGDDSRRIAAVCSGQAMRGGHVEVAWFLIQRHPECIDMWLTMEAVLYGNAAILEQMLALKPSVETHHAKRAAVEKLAEPMGTLKLLFENGTDRTPSDALYHAIKRRRLDLVSYLVEQREGFVLSAMDAARRAGFVEILAYLVQFAHYDQDAIDPSAWVDEAARRRQHDVVAYLRDAFPDALCSPERLLVAARSGDVAMVVLLDDPRHSGIRRDILVSAAEYAREAVITYLAPQVDDDTLRDAAAKALQNGHYHTARLLVDTTIRRREAASSEPEAYWSEMNPLLDVVYLRHLHAKNLERAAACGDENTVRYLVEKRIGDRHMAMIAAIRHGHLAIVRYLIESTDITSHKSLTRVNWLAVAAQTNHLDILMYLHNSVPSLVCRPHAIDHAASLGYFEVVQFLHFNRMEGCTTKAMDGAAYGNHTEIVRFLHANRREGCSRKAFEKSSERGLTDMVKLLLETVPHMCDVDKGLEAARKHGRVETAACLSEIKSQLLTTTIDANDETPRGPTAAPHATRELVHVAS